MTRELFKRKSFWIAVPLVLVIAFVAEAIFASRREPRYGGRPLSYWVDRLPTTIVAPNGYTVSANLSINSPNLGIIRLIQTPQTSGLADKATNAVNELGEKCLPYLMSRLTAQDPAWKIKCSVWAARLGLNNLPWRQHNVLTAGQAVTALDILASRAKGAVPELVKLANDKDPYVREVARHLMEEIKRAQAKGDSV